MKDPAPITINLALNPGRKKAAPGRSGFLCVLQPERLFDFLFPRTPSVLNVALVNDGIHKRRFFHFAYQVCRDNDYLTSTHFHFIRPG